MQKWRNSILFMAAIPRTWEFMGDCGPLGTYGGYVKAIRGPGWNLFEPWQAMVADDPGSNLFFAGADVHPGR